MVGKLGVHGASSQGTLVLLNDVDDDNVVHDDVVVDDVVDDDVVHDDGNDDARGLVPGHHIYIQ